MHQSARILQLSARLNDGQGVRSGRPDKHRAADVCMAVGWPGLKARQSDYHVSVVELANPLQPLYVGGVVYQGFVYQPRVTV